MKYQWYPSIHILDNKQANGSKMPVSFLCSVFKLVIMEAIKHPSTAHSVAKKFKIKCVAVPLSAV